MNTPTENPEIDLQIAEIVSRWMETAQENRPSADELIANHPELAPGLAECLQGLQRIEHGKTLTVQSNATSSDFQNGDVVFPEIPDFEVLGELGRGGMGIVYEAKQRSLDRNIALKVLPFGTVDPRAVKRFLREAETVAALSHPGIVPIYAVGVHEGLNWFAMQRIDGCPLSQWFAVATFESRAATLREVVRVGIEAAEALEHAHQRGVIHRDVKPGNLLVDTTGKVWLTDFGLARRDVDVTATVTGAMLGTPRYMSAEQISNSDEKIDARTDIYSLGATLYEMATGRPPFTSESPLELLTQIRNDEPTPLRQIDSTIPRTLELVILKCLDKDPDRRYRSAAELADDLKAIRDEKPISAKGLPAWLVASRFLKRHQNQVHAVAITVVGTAAAVIAGAMLWIQGEQAKFGLLRINTPASLYVANIQPRTQLSESLLGTTAALIRPEEPDLRVETTPMQKPMSLKAGDYQIRFEGAGSLSQTVDVVVKSQESKEVEYVDRRKSLPRVDIYQKLSVPRTDNALAVLGKETFDVFDPPNKLRFSLPIKQLDAGLADEEVNNSKSKGDKGEDPPLTFAFGADQNFQGDFNVAQSPFAHIDRINTNPVDLNQDGRNDFLITAARHAAIAAISSDGSELWKRRLPMNFEIAEARSRYPKNGIPKEAIVSVSTIDDLDSDGTPDLVVNAALFDPSGFSRPYIFTLSGRDGGEISVAPFPTINRRTESVWPWSGLLKHRRGFNSDERATRMLQTHHETITMRTQSHDSDSWGGNAAYSALIVLPPPIIGKQDNVRIAITATDHAIHVTSLADGTAVCPAFQLFQPILLAPQEVQMAEDKLGVLVLTTPENDRSKCCLELCVLGEAKPRWSIPQEITLDDLVAGAAHISFPMVVDLDGDGNDEILSPTIPDFRFQFPKLHCYSSSGELRWTSDGVAGISRIIDQALPVGDIDRDGVVDLAIVGLHQLSAAQASSLTGSTSKEGLRLTIDFLSGKSGARIGYREEHLSASLKNFDVAEIDYIDRSGSDLICSVVYGSKEELKLSSVTVALDLGNFNPATVARGLTVQQLGSTPIDATSGRWYRRRSGPYANPSDEAVWIAKDVKQSRYPGENLVATWLSPTKEPRLLLSGPNGAVRCINPLNGHNVWTAEQLFFDGNPVLVLDRPDGKSDLVFKNTRGSKAPPGFYDSETGKVRFTIDAPKMDAFHFVTYDKQDSDRYVFALAGADTSSEYGSSLKRDQGFLLLKIDRISGRALWWRNCYQGIHPGSTLRPAEPIQIDLNGDRVTDLIAGTTKNGRLAIEAIDGQNGQVFWELPLQMKVGESPWREPWPLMTLIPSGSQKYLLVVDGVENEDRLIDFRSIGLQDGKELDKLRRVARYILRSDIQSKDLSLHVMAPGKRDGIVGLATAFPDDDSEVVPPQGVMSGKSFGMKMLHFDEQTGEIEPIRSGETPYATAIRAEGPMLGPPNSIFTADIDGDQVLDRIEYFVPEQIKIRPANSESWIAEFKISTTSNVQLDVEQHASKWYLKVVNYNADHTWYELPSGKVALQFGQGLQDTKINVTKYPRLLSHSKGTLLVGSTPEAAICVQVDMDVASPNSSKATDLSQSGLQYVAMSSARTDPRYRKPIVAHGLYDRKSFADVIRLALLTLGAILIPVGYVYQLIRRRRWSLQTLLLAPAIVMLALVSWRALQSSRSAYLIPDTIAGVMAAMSVWAVFVLMRYQKWTILGASIALSMLLATMLMFGAQASFPLRNPGMIGYWTLSAWLTSTCAAAAQIVMPMAVGVAWGQAKAKKAKLLP